MNVFSKHVALNVDKILVTCNWATVEEINGFFVLEVMDGALIEEWYCCFKDSQMSVKSVECLDRSSTSRNPETIKRCGS